MRSFLMLMVIALPVFGQPKIITTVAGSKWVFTGDTKPAVQAPIGGSSSIAIDFRDNVYIADAGNCMVHRIDRQGTLTVIAGNGNCNGDSSYQNTPGRSSALFYPGGVGVDSRRNVYISAGQAILRWNLGGFLNRVAGGPYGTDPDGTLALQARMTYPGPVVFDRSGNLYFVEVNKVRRIRADNGRLETVAGNGVAASTGDGGNALGASLNMGECNQIAFDSQGNLYICERDGRRVRKVDARTNLISTFAGSPTAYWDWTIPRGDGGSATQAAIWPSALAIDAQDNVYITDGGRIRRITQNGQIANYVGQDYEYGLPRGLAIDSQGNLYIHEAYVYKVTPARVVTIFAGNGSIRFGGDGGPATFANMLNPIGLAFDRNSGSLYIGDNQGTRVRKVDAAGNISTVAGTGHGGVSHATGLPAANYPLSAVSGVALDASGRLYISQNNACGIWRIEMSGLMTALGGFPEYGCPRSLASGPDGTIYSLVTEHPSFPNSIWRIEPDGGAIRIAGNGGGGFSGDGGPATSAELKLPSGLAFDTAGRMYISDYGNNRIRRVDPVTGIISTYAGTGAGDLGGDGGPAISARLNGPGGMAFDASGNLFFADNLNHRVRVISAAGIINTAAGTIPYGSGGDAGSATSAGLTFPSSVVFDNAGNLLISDTGNSVVRSVLASQPAMDVLRSSEQSGTEVLALMTFTTIQGQIGGQLSAPLLIKTSGSSSLPYTVTPIPSASWLQVQSTQGTVTGLASVTISVNPSGLNPGTYEGFAVVGVAGAVPAQRRVRIVFTVLPSADLSISALPLVIPDQRTGQRAPVGSNLTFRYSLRNNSQTISDNVAATGTLPANVTFVSCTIGGGQCSGAAASGAGSCPNCGNFSARLDDIFGNATTEIVVTAALNVVADSVSVRSDVIADTTDNNLANNAATVSAIFGGPSVNCGYTLAPASATLGAAGGTFTLAITASDPSCTWSVSGTTAWISADRVNGTGSGAVAFTVQANSGAARTASLTVAGGVYLINQSAVGSVPPSRFVSLTPCRVMETRSEYNFDGRTGAFGPPFLTAGETRNLTLPVSNVCPGIPATARAFVMNVTVIPRGQLDFVTVYPGGESRPAYYTVRSQDGLIVANSAIVPAGPGGTINVYASNATDIIIDISGYFTSDPAVSNLVYYPLTPCRVIDTRAAYRQPAGPYAAPSLAARQTRNFRFPNNPYCASIPSGAAAYSVTITVAPPGPLAFLSAWPQGTTQPNVSTLNSPNGRVLANSVILPPSADGGISVFAFDSSDMIVDINGYFAPDDGVNGLFYFPTRQCRVSDTTNGSLTGVFGGPAFENETKRSIPIPQSGCSIPATARAYALNATVIPNGSPMPFLSVWPTGQVQPNASVINAFEGQTVSSGFLVPVGTNGAVDVYAFRRTQVVLEIAGYFGR